MKIFFLVQRKCDRRTKNGVSMSSRLTFRKYSLWYCRVSPTMTASRVHSQNRNKISDEHPFPFFLIHLFVSMSIEHQFGIVSAM